MRLRVALLVAAASIAAAALSLHHGRGSTPRDPAAVVAASPSARVPPPPPRAARMVAPAVEHARTDDLPPALEPAYLAVEHAAKDCVRGRDVPAPIRSGGPDETVESLQVEYTLVVADGVGHTEDLRVVTGALTDADLQGCILEAAVATTWTSQEPDGILGTLQQNLNLGDLLRPDHGMPPPSERSPMPTAPPPPELAGPLGESPEDDAPAEDVVVYAPEDRGAK